MDKITVAFGRRLRLLRESRGLSQDRLAAKANLHRNYLGMLERGKTGTTLESLAAIAGALGVGLPELVALDAPLVEPTAEEAAVQKIVVQLRGQTLRKIGLVEKVTRVLVSE